MIWTPTTDFFLMIERLDCISVFRELLFITYLRTRPRNPTYNIPFTYHTSCIPSLPQFYPLRTRTHRLSKSAPWIFFCQYLLYVPAPVCSSAASFLSAAAGLGTTADLCSLPAYIM